MSPRLKINSYVIERLSKVTEEAASGCLYGLMYDGTLLVVGLSVETEQSGREQLLLHLPTEVELCGVFHFGDEEYTDREILQEVDITDNPLVLSVLAGGALKAHFLVHDRLEETSHEVLPAEQLWRQFVHVRLHTVLPLVCEATVNGVKNALQARRKKIASGQVSFHMAGSAVHLLGEAGEAGAEGSGEEATFAQVLDTISPEYANKKKRISLHHVDIVPVNVFMKVTKGLLGEKFVKTAVKMVTAKGKPAYCISVPLNVDGLALVHRDVTLSELYSVLVESACRALRLLESVLLHQLGQEGIGDGAGIQMPETFHTLPPELGHFVTRVLPRGQPEECSETDRRLLHKQLCLPATYPIFRRGNAYIMHEQPLLVNPHESLPARPARADVITAVVRGRYTYHHYMQDRFNDDGWGCAYRSLQTLCSWFRLQGYTSVPIPSHRDIQQCLVSIGDKPSAFVGSRQWIGSTEVSFCLESMLGVQSRIVFANSGAEMKDYSPELVHHFQKHGSPIMIGGGVLAHTILGIEYNTSTRETNYLILDPHYTGAEDVGVVAGKGWCGWKSQDFWNKTAHYNLCLPQTRPCV